MRTKHNILDRELIIQSYTTTGDGMGGSSTQWSDKATVFAHIHPLEGKEKLRAQAINSTLSHRITMRLIGDLSTKDRMKYGKKYFNIHSVIDKGEQHNYLEIMASQDAS